MKKIILLLILAFIGMSCFGEVKIRHDVCGYTTQTIYWNTDYNGGPDNTNWAENFERTRERYGWKAQSISDFLIGSPNDKTRYRVLFLESNIGSYIIRIYFYDGDFEEKLRELIYEYEFEYNFAKEAYDNICKNYKECVKNNYHHYK